VRVFTRKTFKALGKLVWVDINTVVKCLNNIGGIEGGVKLQ